MQDFEFFLCIFLYHLVLFLERPGSLPYGREEKGSERTIMQNKNHQASASGIYVGEAKRGLQGKPSGTKICTKRIRNLA